MERIAVRRWQRLASLGCAFGCAIFVAAAGSVAAPSASPLANDARHAGEACRDGDLDAALGRLRVLHHEVASRVGLDHSATQIVALSISQVEKALGVEPVRQSIREDVREESLEPELTLALQELRSCTRVRPPTAQPEALMLPPPEGLGELDFQAHLDAARVLASKGQYKAAAVSAERAHALALGEKDPKRREVAASTVALLRLQVGDFDGAAASATEAVAIAEILGDDVTRVSMARLFAQLRYLDRAGEVLDSISDKAGLPPALLPELDEARGDIAIRLGAPGRAIELLTRAIDGHREHFGSRHMSTAAVIGLRGTAHRMAGDIPAARTDLLEALSIREGVHGPGHPEVARTHNALGVLMADLGDWADAEHRFSAAESALTTELGKQHPEVVTVRANRVLVEWGREQSKAYAFHYAAVLDALVVAYGADHPLVSEARRNLARMQEELGDTKAAEALLSQAIESQGRALGIGHPALAQTMLARGKFYGRQNRLADAKNELDRAIELLRDHYGDEHPLVARARSSRSRVATAQGDEASAWLDAEEAARGFDLHLERSFGAMPDRHRVLLAADATQVVGSLLSAAGKTPRDAYVAMIPQRDSVLRSIAASRARERDLPDRGRVAIDELQKLRARYVAAVLSESHDAAERSRRLASAIDAQQSVVTLSTGLQRDLDPSEILHRACFNLPSDSALVEFVVYDRVVAGSGVDPTPSYLAWIVRPAPGANEARECKVERVELGPASKIDDVADAFAKAMREQRSDAPKERAQLAKQLLEPLRTALRGSRRWLVIPDGSLWGVPLGALPDPEAPDRYLVERVTTGNLTSIHELADYSAGTDIAGTKALLFGAPEFGGAEAGAGAMVLSSTGPCRLEPFEPLPATARELSEINRLLPDARLVLGADATKRRLLDELASRPVIVHLATHAYFAGAGGCRGSVAEPRKDSLSASALVVPNPLLLSGIVFAGANRQTSPGGAPDIDGSSGILTALEMAGLDLTSARLVVLSACDTGTGLHNRGQEVQGLRWGVRAAGAKSLVTSLWLSNDVVTRKLMSRFYETLVAKKPAGDLFEGAEALRAAQLSRVESESRLKLRKPSTWANFVFSGLY